MYKTKKELLREKIERSYVSALPHMFVLARAHVRAMHSHTLTHTHTHKKKAIFDKYAKAEDDRENTFETGHQRNLFRNQVYDVTCFFLLHVYSFTILYLKNKQ